MTRLHQKWKNSLQVGMALVMQFADHSHHCHHHCNGLGAASCWHLLLNVQAHHRTALPKLLPQIMPWEWHQVLYTLPPKRTESSHRPECTCKDKFCDSVQGGFRGIIYNRACCVYIIIYVMAQFLISCSIPHETQLLPIHFSGKCPYKKWLVLFDANKTGNSSWNAPFC